MSKEKDTKEKPYTIQIPSSSEWDSGPDLQVIDRRTGKVVSILEQVRAFEMCEGIVLQVKTKEIDRWKKETANAKKLTKRQNELLKKFISQVGETRPLTRQEIVTCIEEIRKQEKPQRFRQSGHFVDQKLKYKEDPQLTIFDYLSPKAQEEIQKHEMKVEGIHLTPPQDKLINTLNKILFNKSEIANSNSPSFYLGNTPPATAVYGGQKTSSAVIRFTPHELYTEYIGSKEYSGADIAFIREILWQLSEKKFLITYDRHRKVKNGNKMEKRIDKIVEFQPLIKIIQFYEGLTTQQSQEINSGKAINSNKGEIIIGLNPIFTDQIDTKYIEYPADINRRMVIASGGSNRVTQSMILLRDWLLRALSNKESIWEIYEKKLPSALKLDKYIKQGRKKLLKKRIDKDIQAMVNLGLVIKVEKTKGAKGQSKYLFYLNKEYDSGG